VRANAIVKITTADFVTSYVSLDQFPHERIPELACVGRSNVGKSSLINALLSRNGLAKVSGTPGKTRLMNVFRVSTEDAAVKSFYLVDLPGYGFAKVSKSVRAQWGPMIERYLTGRSELCGVLLLVDARRVQAQDVMTYEWFESLGIRLVVVATKIDKLARGERRKSLEAVRRTLQLPTAVPLVSYSSVTREGSDELWRLIREMIIEKKAMSFSPLSPPSRGRERKGSDG
jgi:GTP-binding protein